MLRFLYIFFQFIILLIIASWAIQNSKPVSFLFRDIIVTTSTSVLIIFLLIIIIVSLLLQRFVFFLKQSKQKFKFYRERAIYEKGQNAFVQGMVALANKDFKKAISEAKNANKYLKNKSLGLLLSSEVLKIEKKFDQLSDVYEAMIKNPDMNLLGLRGLMEQNLRAQDYHHAFIYGEKLFHLNPRIDKLYETLVNIIGKTNNWQKLIYLSDQSFKYKIINKKINAENKSIAFFEIAKIKNKSSRQESINLMEKALKLKENFAPFMGFYIQLLIEDNSLKKAKKILKKAWTAFPHPDLKKQIKVLAKALKVPYYEMVEYVSSNTQDHYETRVLLSESYIQEQNWDKARQQIKSLLEHKPPKEICLLMAKIEEGASGDPQKINAWISRSNLGKLSKIWICHISGISQTQWTSVSKGGYFNTLDWRYSNNMPELQGPGLEISPIDYIEA